MSKLTREQKDRALDEFAKINPLAPASGLLIAIAIAAMLCGGCVAIVGILIKTITP